MDTRVYVNNFSGRLNGSINNSTTTIVLVSATGLPTLADNDYYYLTLDNYAGVVEIVKVTARTGTTLTVVRGQEGTSGVSWPDASFIEMRFTKSSGTSEPGTAGNMMISDGNAWRSVPSQESYNSTASATGTLTLTKTSAIEQFITGSTTHTVVAPDVSTLTLGKRYLITNLSTGAVTLQSSGANTIQVLAANSAVLLICISLTGTTAASWAYIHVPVNSSISGTGLLLRQTSPTLVTPVLGVATATSINFGGSDLSTYAHAQTFTPVFYGSATAGSPTGTFVGRYIKIGRLVNITVQAVFTSLSTMDGNLMMSGMPFTTVNNSAARAGIAVGFRNNFTNDFDIIGYANNNDTVLNFWRADQDATRLTIADLSATTNFYFQLTYESAT